MTIHGLALRKQFWVTTTRGPALRSSFLQLTIRGLDYVDYSKLKMKKISGWGL